MAKSKILIIDDDFDLRRGLSLRLRANNYETLYATDGLSATAMAQKEHPDLIILDLGWPARRRICDDGKAAKNRESGLHSRNRADLPRSASQQGTGLTGGSQSFLSEAGGQ
jgi:CheY-like chemotaxis protein